MHFTLAIEKVEKCNKNDGSLLEFISILLDSPKRMNLAAYNYFIIKQEISLKLRKEGR